jgi:hypothetical protein
MKMETEKAIKLLISSFIAIIIDLSFSITDIVKETIAPVILPSNLFFVKSFLILCFFIVEIAGIYGLLQKLNIFDKMGLE